MSQKQTKRRRANADIPLRRTITKHRKIMVESDDSDGDTAISNTLTEDASLVHIASRRLSSLPSCFVAVRPIQSIPATDDPARTRTSYHHDPIPHSEIEFFGEQAELAVQEFEREVVFSSGPDGRIYKAVHDAEQLSRKPLADSALHISGSGILIGFNPFSARPPI